MVLQSRPLGITALSIFFLAGAIISFAASISLLAPDSFLKSMWRLNPARKRTSQWSVFAAAVGLWRTSPCGYWLGITVIG
jgi:hypothetical protein